MATLINPGNVIRLGLAFLVAATFVLGLPVNSRAAYNDVTMTTDARITAGGATLSVSGSNAVVESITVASSNFAVTLLPSSYLQVTSAGRYRLTHNAQFYFAPTCTATDSLLTFDVPSGGPTMTVTVTPDTSSSCDGESGGSGGGGGGGGGGGAPPPSPPAPPPVTPQLPVAPPDQQALIVAIQAQITQLVQQIVQQIQQMIQQLLSQLLSQLSQQLPASP